jgi:hypothetical protein
MFDEEMEERTAGTEWRASNDDEDGAARADPLVAPAAAFVAAADAAFGDAKLLVNMLDALPTCCGALPRAEGGGLRHDARTPPSAAEEDVTAGAPAATSTPKEPVAS